MSAQVHPLFRDVHVVHSLCNALCSVFGVDFSERLKRNEKGHVVTDIPEGWTGRVPMYMVRYASTVYFHCLSLSSTCKRAREIITAAFNERLSFYFIFHLDEYFCQSSVYGHISSMLANRERTTDLREALRLARGLKNVSLGVDVTDFKDDKHSVLRMFARFTTNNGTSRDVKLFSCEFPRDNDLYEWVTNNDTCDYLDHLCARRDLCLQRLISASYTNSKRVLHKRSVDLCDKACKRLKITHNQ